MERDAAGTRSRAAGGGGEDAQRTSAGDFATPAPSTGVLAHPRDVEACARRHRAREVRGGRRRRRAVAAGDGFRRASGPTGSGRSPRGSVTSAELAAFAAPLAKEPKLNARHRALLELAAAVASALPGRCRGAATTFERRDACLRVILSETHSAAMKRRGDGSGPAAAARALVACSGTRTDPGAPARAAARRLRRCASRESSPRLKPDTRKEASHFDSGRRRRRRRR